MAKLNKTPLQIRAKRGTEAQITETSPAPYQLEGEIAYATDTDQFYVSNGTKFLRVITTDTNGDVYLKSDNDKIFLGTAKDVEQYYDGTDFKIDIGVVAPSDLVLDCGTEKTLELAEVVWKDMNVGSAQLSRPASSQPDEDNFMDENGADTGITTLAYAIGEKASGSFEMQHDYKQGSDFTFHLHWQGITAPSGTDNVQWRLTYTLMRDGTTLDAVTIIDSPDTPFDTQYEGVRTDFAAITGTNYLIGDQFLFTIERVASTGDAYAGDALVATVGIHYSVDTVGSREILTK